MARRSRCPPANSARSGPHRVHHRRPAAIASAHSALTPLLSITRCRILLYVASTPSTADLSRWTTPSIPQGLFQPTTTGAAVQPTRPSSRCCSSRTKTELLPQSPTKICLVQRPASLPRPQPPLLEAILLQVSICRRTASKLSCELLHSFTTFSIVLSGVNTRRERSSVIWERYIGKSTFSSNELSQDQIYRNLS